MFWGHLSSIEVFLSHVDNFNRRRGLYLKYFIFLCDYLVEFYKLKAYLYRVCIVVKYYLSTLIILVFGFVPILGSQTWYT